MTPFGLIDLASDRQDNVNYSSAGVDGDNIRMKEVYKSEMPHFLASINPHSQDPRFQVPQETVLRLAECLIDDLERAERDGQDWWHEY